MSKYSGSLDYSVVIPVYNAEESLVPLYQRLVKVFEDRQASFELVYVEDAGGDGSWKVLKDLAARDPRVCVVRLMRNFGQANATICGLSHARGRHIVTMDDDLQHPPEEINVLISALEDDPDMDAFIGSYDQKQHPLWRRISSRVLSLITNQFFGAKRSLQITSFRIMRRQVVDGILEFHTPHPAVGALLLAVTPRVANVQVRHEPRAAGQGGYTVSKLFGLTLSRFLSFSTLPLRLLAFIGLVGILASLGMGLFYLLRYWTGGIGVPGFTTLAVLLVALSGFNFFAFGVVGEYLLRILQSVYDTPTYRVREIIKAGQSSEATATRGSKPTEIEPVGVTGQMRG